MAEAATTIRPLHGQAEAEWCARLMAESEPWRTLHRDYRAAISIFSDPDVEKYIALVDGEPAGFLLIIMIGAFTGYIKSVAVAPSHRNRGLGRRLLTFAEQRIFSEQPNVFICVSTFNAAAKRLYERMGYKEVGLLADYIIHGHGEYLLRKSIAPLSEFKARPPDRAAGEGTAPHG